jgi:hypothetical protein
MLYLENTLDILQPQIVMVMVQFLEWVEDLLLLIVVIVIVVALDLAGNLSLLTVKEKNNVRFKKTFKYRKPI